MMIVTEVTVNFEFWNPQWNVETPADVKPQSESRLPLKQRANSVIRKNYISTMMPIWVTEDSNISAYP